MSEKIVLIDGNSLTYRAFFALPTTLKNSTGQVTNVVYGFVNMMLKILEMKPDFIAISFDLPKPTFRHVEYKEYKAHRPPAPDELKSQIPLVKDFVKLLDIPIFEIEGYEADDVIGTLAEKASKAGMDVDILTGDLDTLQLINDKVKILTTRKGITDIVIYDKDEVDRRYGLTPEQIVDFKGLKGDPSDNIPGVKGIGEKTAIELLKKFGTMEELYEHIDEVTAKKAKQNLIDNKETAFISKKLATIVTDVPIEIDLATTKHFAINWAKVVPFFKKMEFGSLIKKYEKEVLPLFDTSAGEETEKIEKKEKDLNLNYQAIITKSALDELQKKLETAKLFAFDCETSSTNPLNTELFGISFSIKDNEAYYIPFNHADLQSELTREQTLAQLKPIFENKNILKTGQNIKFDIEVIGQYGIRPEGIAADTMVAEYILDPTTMNYGIKYLARKYLDREVIDFSTVTKDKDKDFSKVTVKEATDYSCADADIAFQLTHILEKSLKANGLDKLYSEIEIPLIPILVNMESNGIYIDIEKLKTLSIYIDEKMQELEKLIFAIADEEFNLNSPKQLQEILFTKLAIPPTKKTKTGFSTDSSVLEELAREFEIAKYLIEYRQFNKLKTTYVETLPELTDPKTHRIHTSFNQTITATGRLSSSNPNLQNIPIKTDLGRKIRAAFIPEKSGWVLLAADYSQIELRILAHLSDDTKMIDAFKHDKDIHSATAAEIFNTNTEHVTDSMRYRAKTVNFGIIYGQSDFGLSKTLGIKRAEAKTFIEQYFDRYPTIKSFIEATIKKAKETEVATTLFGRRRPLPDINSANYNQSGFAERIAVNTLIQGTAADIIKIAMINVFKQMQDKNLQSRMLLQVHDELIFEVPEDEVQLMKDLVAKQMSQAADLKVPLKVDIHVGRDWGQT